MVNAQEAGPSVGRYGPIGFVAALLNILVIEFVTWVLLPWFYLAIFLVPVLLLDFAVSVILATRNGRLRQVGWGMMIGCIAGPAALVVFIPLYLLIAAVGLI